MDAVKFLEEDSRMCNTYKDCIGCPIHNKPFCHPHDMTTNDERKELVDAVERWSYEHPMATNEMSDTISRAMAINEIARWIGYLDDDMIGRIQLSLKRLPSTQPKRDIPLDCIIDESGNAICPKCGANVEWHKYCEKCGQALKWEE